MTGAASNAKKSLEDDSKKLKLTQEQESTAAAAAPNLVNMLTNSATSNSSSSSAPGASSSSAPLLLSSHGKRDREDDGDNHPCAKVQRKLIDMVEVLKTELDLKGNMRDVVNEAANLLGVASEDKSLGKIAADCMCELGIED